MLTAGNCQATDKRIKRCYAHVKGGTSQTAMDGDAT